MNAVLVCLVAVQRRISKFHTFAATSVLARLTWVFNISNKRGYKVAQKIEMRFVRLCERCHGAGEIMGAVMRIDCDHCYGHRFISSASGEPASGQELGAELHNAFCRTAMVFSGVEQAASTSGPEAAYQGSNGRGAGGSNYTGD